MADDDTRWATQAVSAAKLNALGFFAYTNLAAFPAASMEIGVKGIAEDNGKIYQNTGTFATPSWTVLGEGVPIGALTMWTGTEASISANWKICNGAAISRTTYADLFAIMSTEYGAGNGSTTFNIPDFQTSNLFPRAASNDAGRGATGGSSTHTLSIAEMPSHNHTVQSYPSAGSMKIATATFSAGSPTSVGDMNNTGGGGSHENKPPYVDVHFILKVL